MKKCSLLISQANKNIQGASETMICWPGCQWGKMSCWTVVNINNHHTIVYLF